MEPKLSKKAAMRLLNEIFAPDEEIIPMTDEEIEAIEEEMRRNPPTFTAEEKRRFERHRLEFLDMIRDDKENS